MNSDSVGNVEVAENDEDRRKDECHGVIRIIWFLIAIGVVIFLVGLVALVLLIKSIRNDPSQIITFLIVFSSIIALCAVFFFRASPGKSDTSESDK